MNTKRFSAFAWVVLLYNMAVIAWGAFVRASFSGDGCGSHWPLCNGQVVPTEMLSDPDRAFKTMVEYGHRVSTAVDGLLVLALVFFAFRLFKGRVRWAALGVLFFTMTEALVGRKLVVSNLVTYNTSVDRAVWMAFHLCNTFFLLGCLAVTAMWAGGAAKIKLKGQGAVAWAIGLGLVGVFILGISGAVTALGDTVFPPKDSMEVIRQSLTPGVNFLLKLRIVHPLIATSVGLYLVLLGGLLIHLRPNPLVKKTVQYAVALYMAQLALGLLNVQLKAPVALQLPHLVLADALWVAMVTLGAISLSEGIQRREYAVVEQPIPAAERPKGKELVKLYLLLTKPRVISLLLFTTLTAMFIAERGLPNLWLVLAVAVGGYMSAGAANTINMVIDRDIDGTMVRTSKRPTVTQAIPSTHALIFGLSLAVGSFVVLWQFANLLTATLSLAGLVFYVVIYTLILKRRTWHNIVIGGAAGAFPPLVGWAAVTNSLTPLAWYLFAIVFVWTPVHFWALALLIKDDYEKAGVPMLPVVMGERMTVIQIAAYAVLTAIVSLLPLLQKEVGVLYVVSALLLNVVLLIRCTQLYVNIDRPRAVSLYKYSMLYLALLFLMAAIDRAVSL